MKIDLAPWKGFVYLQWFMNDEHHTTTPPVTSQTRSLEQRLARRPQVLARFRRIADMMDQAITEGCTADEAEAQAVEQIRHLGRDLMSDWAAEKQRPSLAVARLEHPGASQHAKKK